jgi:hypothetical protein
MGGASPNVDRVVHRGDIFEAEAAVHPFRVMRLRALGGDHLAGSLVR